MVPDPAIQRSRECDASQFRPTDPRLRQMGESERHGRGNDYQPVQGAGYVRPSLEGRPLAKVTPLDVQAVYGKIIEKGLSARTVRYTHAVLRSALQQAVKMATARLQSGGLGLTAQAIEKGDPGSVDRVDAGVSAGRRQGPHRRVVRVGGDGRPASE